MGLSVEVTDARNVLVVRLTGELDHHTAEKVRNRIDEKLGTGSYTNLILNLSGLTFMDSSGLGVLLGRYKRVSQLGGSMILCSVNPSIYRLMELSGLFKILPIYKNEQTALKSCEVTS